MTTCTMTQYTVRVAQNVIETAVYLELQGRGVWIQIDLDPDTLGTEFSDAEVALAAADILGLPIVVAT